MHIQFFAPVWFTLVFLCVLDCNAIKELNRNSILPLWEKVELDELVWKYEHVRNFSASNSELPIDLPTSFEVGNLVNDFMNLCCRNVSSDTELTSHLKRMASDPIGRELIYRTMAKIAPREKCLESIDRVLDYATKKRETIEKLGVLASLTNQLGVLVSAPNGTISIKELLQVVRQGGCSSKFNILFNDPKIFHRRTLVVGSSGNKKMDEKVFFFNFVTYKNVS